MALRIDSTCINCDICQPECPNGAIYLGKNIYEIYSHLCTECVGHYDKPNCISICPINCIKPDTTHLESTDELMKKFLQLHKS